MKFIKSNKGFSLIELLISISVLVILVTLATPLFFPENVKFDSWSNGIYNALYRAKTAAIINLYEVGFIALDNRNFLIFLDTNRSNSFDNNDRIIIDSRNVLNDFNNRNSSIQDIIISFPNTTQSVMFNPNNVIFKFNSLGFVLLPDGNNFNSITLNLINNRVSYRYSIILTPGGDIDIRKVRN